MSTSRRRARPLALPFVATATLLPACAPPPPPPPSPLIVNPPRPLPTTHQQPPAEVATSPQAHPTHGPTIERAADGTCYAIEGGPCPPGVKCNPPPPRRVACPTP